MCGGSGAHGMGRLFDLGALHGLLPGPVVAGTIAEAMASGQPPEAIFVPASYDGRDIAARLSVKLDVPVIANVVGLVDEGHRFVAEHAISGGSEIARSSFTGPGPAIFVINPKSFLCDGSHEPQITVQCPPLPVPDATDGARVVYRHVELRRGSNLDDASVIVSGGRGLGSKENYALVERLAAALHGAPAATRAIVDAGWVPYALQVGQTGKTVKPDAYIAFGISGAAQHLVGMNGARGIIAINVDPNAPIMRIADLGVVGDAVELIPRLIRAIEARLDSR